MGEVEGTSQRGGPSCLHSQATPTEQHTLSGASPHQKLLLSLICWVCLTSPPSQPRCVALSYHALSFLPVPDMVGASPEAAQPPKHC